MLVVAKAAWKRSQYWDFCSGGVVQAAARRSASRGEGREVVRAVMWLDAHALCRVLGSVCTGTEYMTLRLTAGYYLPVVCLKRTPILDA